MGDAHTVRQSTPASGFAVQFDSAPRFPIHAPTGMFVGEGRGIVFPGFRYGPSGSYDPGIGYGRSDWPTDYRPPTKFALPRISMTCRVMSIRKEAGMGLIGVMPMTKEPP